MDANERKRRWHMVEAWVAHYSRRAQGDLCRFMARQSI